MIFCQIDVAVLVNFYAVGAQQICLHFSTAECKCRSASSETIDHSETRHVFGIGVEMQSIPHRARCPRGAAKTSDLPVGCNLAVRNFFDLLIYDVVKAHMYIICKIDILCWYFQQKNTVLRHQINFLSIKKFSRISAASPHIFAHGRVL